jgi:hypothetical protein
MTHLRAVSHIRRLAAAMAVAGVSLAATWVAGAGAASPIGAYTTKGAWSFFSAPNLHPPKLGTDAPTVGNMLAPGDFLTANFPNLAATHPARGAGTPMIGQGGPLLLNNKLQPVWFNPVATNVVSADLQQETYQGRPVLLWWQGVITNTGAATSGEIVVVDQHYRKIATLKAQSPWTISLHDAVISAGNIWVTVYRNVPNQNLVAYGGSPTGTVYDAGVQEYNLKTGTLIYTWDALNPGGIPNVPLSDSEQPAPGSTPSGAAWDAYHVNSVQVLPGNEILVSMRNTWAAYLIDTTTSKIVWTLGGKSSADSFTIPSNARFAWQHDVQLLSNNQVSLFNDACCKLLAGPKLAPPNGPSQGMVLRLNTASHTVSLVAAYPHAPKLNVAFLGSMQVLPKSAALVGWGSLPYLSEYSKSGKLLLEALWPGPDQSYRARYTGNWVGTPYYPPSGAVRNAHGNPTVYASWDGATQVAAWEVLAGPSAKRLRRVATARKNGFETAIALKKGYKVYEVRALDAKRRAIGTSEPFPKKAPPPPRFY